MIPNILDNQENGVFDFDGIDNRKSGSANILNNWIYWDGNQNENHQELKEYDYYINKLAAGDTRVHMMK